MEEPEFDWGIDFDNFLESLTEKDKALVLDMIIRIENSGMQDSIRKNRVKKLEDNLYEIRLIGTDKKLIRSIYFQLKQNQYYIVSGFIKKTDKTPPREIKKAKERRNKELNKNE